MFSNTIHNVILATIFHLAVGRPVPSSDAVSKTLTLRQNSAEALYLADCHDYFTNTDLSMMAYYTYGLWASQAGEWPDALAYAGDPNIADPGSVQTVHWEGNEISADFGLQAGRQYGVPNGAAVGAQAMSIIAPDAGSLGLSFDSGTIETTFGQNFRCYKDNGRELFNMQRAGQASNLRCWSRYYCFDVSM